MRYSELFPKAKKTPPKDAESVNHKLLVRAGFIDQLMSGSWTLLPLGLRVINKINNIIREEMNAIGALEMLMPLLHPKDIWNETGRWEKAGEIMYKLVDKNEREYALSFTHEEIVMDLLRKHIQSYHDLPISIYHFSTKFRNELRAKNGILRGREFMMKDLYSVHSSQEDLMAYYERVKGAYKRIFQRLGFNFKVAKASGGVFTDKFTHEFQVLSDAGEDTIYWREGDDEAVNEEIFDGDKSQYLSAKSIEVGNIFPLGTWYAEKMGVYFVDKDGNKKPVWFGSYGIGSTRVMGALVEVSHDDNGMIWFPQVSPFDSHLLSIGEKSNETAEKIYQKLTNEGVEVLYDDRDVSAGEKFADADLIGIPFRLLVSDKTGSEIEWKERTGKEMRLMNVDEVLRKLKQIFKNSAH